MVNNYSEEFVNKVDKACLGQPVRLDGVLVRLAIGEGIDFEPCDACVFKGACLPETCDFCCMCEGSEVDNWVYFEKV